MLCSVFGPCFVMQYFVTFYSFAIILVRKIERERERERTVCFTFIVFLIICDCLCSVALPHGTVYWSAVCDCGHTFFLSPSVPGDLCYPTVWRPIRGQLLFPPWRGTAYT